MPSRVMAGDWTRCSRSSLIILMLSRDPSWCLKNVNGLLSELQADPRSSGWNNPLKKTVLRHGSSNRANLSLFRTFPKMTVLRNGKVRRTRPCHCCQRLFCIKIALPVCSILRTNPEARTCLKKISPISLSSAVWFCRCCSSRIWITSWKSRRTF